MERTSTGKSSHFRHGLKSILFEILLLSGFSLQSVMLEHGYDDFVVLLAMEFGVLVLAERCCSSLSCSRSVEWWALDGMRNPLHYTRIYASPITTSSPPAAGSSSVSSSAGVSV